MPQSDHRYTPAFRRALDMVDSLDVALVPIEPDSLMLEAGARAGGIDAAVAMEIYRAMVMTGDLK